MKARESIHTTILSGIWEPNGRDFEKAKTKDFDMFDCLSDKAKEILVRVMARIMESAYRRGCQQGMVIAENLNRDPTQESLKMFRKVRDGYLRYEYSLDISPRHDIVDNYKSTVFGESSVERLRIEYGQYLYEIGFYDTIDRLERKLK